MKTQKSLSRQKDAANQQHQRTLRRNQLIFVAFSVILILSMLLSLVKF